MPTRGAVAAGHPLTAEAGAQILRAGGNAVDAAVAAVLCSLITESPLTGLGAGGFMLVHAGGEDVLLDFFVAAPGRDGHQGRSELDPVVISFGGADQVFHIGEASCGVPGVPAGLSEARARFGTLPMADLVAPAVALARHGVEINRQQAYLFELLRPILATPGIGEDTYTSHGRILGVGQVFRRPELADALERYAAEGHSLFYEGDFGTAILERVSERGGTIGPSDLAAYQVLVREPVRASYADVELFSNPPPSAGGLLIAFALDLLDRIDSSALDSVVSAMAHAQAARTEDFHAGLAGEGFAEQFLAEPRLRRAAAAARADPRPPGAEPRSPIDRLGSTTHISVIDGDGQAATVTCSNGSGSGVYVSGTGVHLNNMLGEEDLNPFGFFSLAAGARVPSMMSPSLLLRDGEVIAALGSGGSNRIRSAILQTIVGLVGADLDPSEAVARARVHFEAGVVHAEPGIDEQALLRLANNGYSINHWSEPNLFFGGVNAVTRDPGTGELSGGGDPRRGGAVVLV